MCDTQEILRESPALYNDLPEGFGFLQGPALRPKPMAFSYLMSHMNYPGMFFPFTGEANINVHAPGCFIPSTVAHELTHQQGVAREQDANFIAVVVCMESEDARFAYSGALLAYTHLSNALRAASYEDWAEVYSHLEEHVLRDLSANNEYWAQFQTPAAEFSEAVYEEFLQNHGQELGMRSYGACVDLLVAYYGGLERQAIAEVRSESGFPDLTCLLLSGQLSALLSPNLPLSACSWSAVLRCPHSRYAQ
jgi:hypothetical protein